MQQLDLLPNTDAWLEARKNYRTASEAAIVMGISPWTSINDFLLIRAGKKKQYYSKAMKRGHDTEEQIRQWANKLLGLELREEIWTNGKYLASLDGIDDNTIVEIKTSDYTYEDLQDGIIPEYYMCQIQQQLYCSGADVAYLAAYSPTKDAYAISDPIEFDKEIMFKIEDAWIEFDKLPTPEGPTIADGDGEIVDLFLDYEGLKYQAEEIKAKMDAVKNKLIKRANDNNLVANGYKLTKSKPRMTIDYKKAAMDAKLELETYTKAGASSWSISIPKNPFQE